MTSLRRWPGAFARANAPLYTTPYVKDSGGNCTSDFELGRFDGPNVGLELSDVKCARQHVRDMLAAGSFAAACTAARELPRYAVPIYAQAVMRMQSKPVRDALCSGQCSVDSGWPRDEISP